MIWILILAIFLALAIYSAAVDGAIERIRRRRVDRALVAAAVAGTARTDTLTCPRCRRAWPLVDLVGVTRCPNPRCRAILIGVAS